MPVLMSGVSINQGMVCNHTDSSVLGSRQSPLDCKNLRENFKILLSIWINLHFQTN